jgi:hypothetical protein
MSALKKSNTKSGSKVDLKTGNLRKVKTELVTMSPAKAKALKAMTSKEKAITKLLFACVVAGKAIDDTLRLEVKAISKVVRAYVLSAKAFNKTLGTGATDRVGLDYRHLRTHVNTLAGKPGGETVGKCIRRGVKLALLPIQNPKIFKASKNGGATAPNNKIYATMDVRSESGVEKIKNNVDTHTDVAQSEIERLHTVYSPDVEKKGADGQTKAEREAVDAAQINTTLDGMTVNHLVVTIDGLTSNGQASLEGLTLNELKNAYRMAVCLAQFQLDAKGKGHDNVTKYIQALIDNYQEKDPASVAA